jgi:hypothetical protein
MFCKGAYQENDLGASSASGRSAAAIYGSKWREAVQVMLGCFDASGHESDRPFLVVGGFVSSAGHWDDFSRLWMERLSRDGLAYFHAAEFEAYVGAFAQYRDDTKRKHALATDLMDLISSHAYRYFVQGVAPADLNRVFTESERGRFNINAYALCGRTCVADLGRWIRGDSYNWANNPAPDLIFEQGDIGRGRLEKLLVNYGYPRPRFLPGKKPLPTKVGTIHPFVPLQASDWLAYEAFRLLMSGTPDRDLWRWPMRQFYKMVGVLGFWQTEHLEESKPGIEMLAEKLSHERVVLGHADDAERFK